MDRTVTCTLTIVDDTSGTYADDLQYQSYLGKTVEAPLGNSQLARQVVGLLNRWVDDYKEQCRRDELRVLGRALYAIAFGQESGDEEPPLRAAFESTLKECRFHGHRLRLRLVLSADAKTLSTYPWEFMYLDGPAGNGFFLAGENTSLSLTRYIPNTESRPDRPESASDVRLRILVVESTPPIPGMTTLRAGDFVEHVSKLDAKRFNTKVLPCPTRKELKDEITTLRPHVIHFIGHGKSGFLALSKEAERIRMEKEFSEAMRKPGEPAEPVDEADWVDAETASGLLRTGLDDFPAPPPRLIFLHACEGDKPELNRSNLEGLGSVASELAKADRISGVIAMRYSIGVDDAEIFAKSFYAEIADSRPIDEAMAAARKALAEEPRPGRDQFWNDRGFGTPVIYLRREDALVPPRPSGGGEAEFKKEPCPNPTCLDGLVLRSRHKCQACKEYFTECPEPGCEDPDVPGRPGLVVAKPGYQCRDCDYVVPSSETSVKVPDDPGLRQSSGTAEHRAAEVTDNWTKAQQPESPQQPTTPPEAQHGAGPEPTELW